MSRNPRVVTRAQRAPLRSITALVAMVVPCSSASRSAGFMLAARRIVRRRRNLQDALDALHGIHAIQVGERASDVDAHDFAHGFPFLCFTRGGRRRLGVLILRARPFVPAGSAAADFARWPDHVSATARAAPT